MKHCPDCGAGPLTPDGARDGLPRSYACANCGAVHFVNPRVVATCIAEWQGQVLLCRRSIEPRSGLWNLPGGYVEAAEAVQDAAIRETREEALATVDELALFRVYNLPRYNEIVMVFRGQLRDANFGVGVESSEVRLFARREIPWSELALEADRSALQDYATQRWQPIYATPVNDVRWIKPAVPVQPSAAPRSPLAMPGGTRRRAGRAAVEPARTARA